MTRSSEGRGGELWGLLLIFTDKQSGNPRRGVDVSDDDGPAGSQPLMDIYYVIAFRVSYCHIPEYLNVSIILCPLV